MNINTRISFVKKISIFSEVDANTLKEIAEKMERISVDANEKIFSKGDSFDGLFLIIDGEVKVHDGEYIFTKLSNTEFFGEYSVLDSEKRSASVTATKKTNLFKINHKILSLLLTKPEINQGILKVLVNRLRDNNELQEKLSQQNKEIKKKNKAIEAHQKELKALNATKDKFFTILAHDLRSPFNTIIGLSELLSSNYSDLPESKIKYFADQINNYSKNVFHLLRNLLEWARSQAGMLTLNLEKKDLFEIVEENLKLYEIDAKNKSITLTSKVKKNTKVICDKNTITFVIRNLLSNALKFTPKNGKVSLFTEIKDKNIVLYISDSGIGLSKEEQEKLFQLDKDQASIGISNIENIDISKEKGTGIGLVIVKEFVEKNKGKIEVDSEPGKGSTFSLTLPIA